MSFIDTYEKWFKRLLPSPFIIAIVLTLVTVLLALTFGQINGQNVSIYSVGLQWEKGLWNNSLLVFAFQMMFMLVLGHSMALSKPVSGIIKRLVGLSKNAAIAALVVALFTVLMGYVNWGLALIFGAILARKVGEEFTTQNKSLNYPLIGASGYLGLLVWHGGLSGSSLLKVGESGHIRSLVQEGGENLPSMIPINNTVFSFMNITVGLLLLFLLPMTAYILGRRKVKGVPKVPSIPMLNDFDKDMPEGMEKVEVSAIFGKALGLLILFVVVGKIVLHNGTILGFVNPNFINLMLLGGALFLHKNIRVFLDSIEKAIGGAAGILIQFPLYFGIMGIMVESNLVSQFSHFLVSYSTETTYPIFTFISAAVVNVFVPSGGGQWAIQGPIIMESYLQSGIPLEKSILAMAYGDQLTNMLQPFWALPLLGITGLKAKQILPYCLMFMLVAMAVFIIALLLF